MKASALLARLRAGAISNVSFVDAQKLVEALGFKLLRVAGSHHLYGLVGIPEQLNLQNRDGQAKPYQLRQLMTLLRRYDLSIEEER